MKKIVPFLTVVIIIMIGLVGINYYKEHSKDGSKYINTILKQDAYTYLSKEAKEYIKTVYEETGKVILTEKNKTDNMPYLNPSYIQYLELSEKEKDAIDLIPDTFILDYQPSNNYSSDNLPSSFDLRSVNGKNYISTIKDQGSTEICWAFASIENVETFLMKQSDTSYSDLFPKFSVRQMDYATSTTNFIKSYVNSGTISCTPVESCSYNHWRNPDNGNRDLGKGGNFFTSSIIMANGLSLVDESVLPWTEENHTYWPKDILGYDKSLYEINSTIQMPTINADNASEELINSYINDVKNYIIQYGGPFVGTYSPTSTCGFENTDGTKAIKTDDCVNNSSNINQGHAMQIIGWDDNYEYSYCDAGTNHYAVKNGSCTSGELTQGRGAWILKNSWGVESDYKYVYLTYDSTRLSIGFTTSISEMNNRTWDNNYHANPWVDADINKGMVSVVSQNEEFDRKTNNPEKIEKIKFFAATIEGTYNISINTGENTYDNIATINSTGSGIYNINLENNNIVLNNNTFQVTIEGSNNGEFYNNSISVFTSNVNSQPYVTSYSTYAVDPSKPLSNDNPLFNDINNSSGSTYWVTSIDSHLYNIPPYSELTYTIRKNDVSVSNFVSSKKITYDPSYLGKVITTDFSGTTDVIYGNIFKYANEIGQTWIMEIKYNDTVLNSFPIKFGTGDQSKSTVKLHANNGTNYIYEYSATNKKTTKFSELNGNRDFYNNGYYVISWNTKEDGTGESYDANTGVYVYHDMDLYAQWSNEKINVIVTFECEKYNNTCNHIDGEMESQTISIDDKITLPINNYTKEEYVFHGWIIDRGSISNLFFEEESLSSLYYANYPVFNNAKIKAYADWLEDTNYYTVSFDSNGGTGTMLPINLEKYSYSTYLQTSRLKDNLFSRSGYGFVGWNTKADGTGTSYNNKGTIKSESDVTLYAQWEKRYTVFYNSNGGTGTMSSQEVVPNTSVDLKYNTFTKEGYHFIRWNTSPDGSGTSYTNFQTVTLSDDLTLYAQWEINRYKVTFDSNGGTGIMASQNIAHNTTTNLNVNTFTREGYRFIGWNTSPDGSGTSYTNSQSVTLSGNLTLYAQWSEVVPYTINNYYVDETNNYISKIMVNTEVNYFTSNIILGYGYGIDVDTKIINDKQLLYTGGKTRITHGLDLYQEYTNVVIGDINGDGAINSADLLKIRQHLLGTNILSGAYFLSSDINYDYTINSADLLRVRQHLLGTKPIE